MSRGLPAKVKNLVEKSKDSALLAVEVYNKPRTAFRSGAYITLMCITWTAIFHAVFERSGKKYFYKNGFRRYVKVDGDYKTWELKKCVEEYFVDSNDPVRKNLEFFIPLRNKLEHRFMPDIDGEIFGECQALLINYEEVLSREFGTKQTLTENLVFSLQFTKQNTKDLLKRTMNGETQKILDYIKEFRKTVPTSLWTDTKFSFRVLLIPKIANNANSSDIAVEFVKYDPSKPEEMKRYEHLVAFVKEKQVQVPVINPGKLKAGDVARQVSQKLGKRFNLGIHLKCWKKYNVRPVKSSPTPDFCDTRYAQYDAVHKDYVYTGDWVDFLVGELSQPEKYKEILDWKIEEPRKR